MAKVGTRAFEYADTCSDEQLHERDRAIALQNHGKNLQLAHQWFPHRAYHSVRQKGGEGSSVALRNVRSDALLREPKFFRKHRSSGEWIPLTARRVGRWIGAVPCAV